MNDTEDFSKYPVSLTETRGARDGRTDTWTPRDVLVRLLRDIDSGNASPDHVFVGVATLGPDGDADIGFLQAGSLNVLGQMGMLAHLARTLGTAQE